MLKKLSLLALITVSAGHPVSALEPTDTLCLDMEQCISIALDCNPTVKVADMEITRVDYSKKEILGQLFPEISFGGNYSRTLAKQTMYMNLDGFGGFGGGDSGEEAAPQSRASESKKDNGIKMGLDNSWQVGFSAGMPLIAPQLWKSISLSDAQILQNVEKARASRLTLINQVQNACYTIMLARDSYEVIRRNYETALYNYKIIEGKYKVGTASEYDVLRQSVQVKNYEPELLQGDIAVKQGYLQLKVLMGIPVETSLKLAGELKNYEETMYAEVLGIDRSLAGNTDLRSLDLQTDYLQKALKVQQMEWIPTLSLSANYFWTSMSNGNPFTNFRWNPYSTIGLSLNVPIFQGGRRYSKTKQAEIAVREMGFQRENLERSLNMQVDLQVDNINRHVKQIASNSAGVEQAEKAFSIMQRSFEIGAASSLDLRDAELALTQARLAYFQAIYNYLVARSDLQLLLGNADPDSYKSGQQVIR